MTKETEAIRRDLIAKMDKYHRNKKGISKEDWNGRYKNALDKLRLDMMNTCTKYVWHKAGDFILYDSSDKKLEEKILSYMRQATVDNKEYVNQLCKALFVKNDIKRIDEISDSVRTEMIKVALYFGFEMDMKQPDIIAICNRLGRA